MHADGRSHFFSKLSLKIVLCNGTLRHTAEAWWGTNRPRLAEWVGVARYLKIPHCSLAMSAKHRSIFAALHLIVMAPLYLSENSRVGRKTEFVYFIYFDILHLWLKQM